jgi:hypothetical protein
MRPPRSARLVAVVVTGLAAAACGSSGRGAGTTASSRPSTSAKAQHGPPTPAPKTTPQVIPTPGPTGRPASAAAVRVIKAWSSALRHGDVRAAADYFALPSQFVNGGGAGGNVLVVTIRTRAEAAAINATLPCGAVFLSADQRGRYVNALFRLTDRPGPGGGCGSGAGQVARTNFVIAAGRIVEWFRAPSDPGDASRGAAPAAPATPAPQPAPSAPQTGAPAV